jgi:putative tryptophan/tyrosine transport system substrate-binding protein
MRRREFITLLGGMAATIPWPLTARAQQTSGMRRIVVLLSGYADDQGAKTAIAAFQQGLQQLGWIDGQNVRTDFRLGAGYADNMRKHLAELATLSPDLIVAVGSSAVGQVLQATRTVPIVFVFAPDPVGSGFVKSLSRPGGNATGFMAFEYSLSAKWPELLKQIVPDMKRAAVLWDPGIPAGIGQFAVIQSVAPSLGMEVNPIDLNDVEQGIAAFARSGSGGLIVTASGLAVAQRDLIVALAAKHKLPAVYIFRSFVAAGGLISYGADFPDQFRQAAGYVDRILKGEKPTDLPVQAPTKYDLAINLKTAKALGLEMPAALLARADEVIE